MKSSGKRIFYRTGMAFFLKNIIFYHKPTGGTLGLQKSGNRMYGNREAVYPATPYYRPSSEMYQKENQDTDYTNRKSGVCRISEA